MPKKSDQETKDRVMHPAEERIASDGCAIEAACKEIAPKLSVLWHSARRWLGQARKAGVVLVSFFASELDLGRGK